MQALVTLMLQSATPQPQPQPWSLDRSTAPPTASLSTSTRCSPAGAGDDVIVCADRADRYRLPLPSERDEPTQRHRGEARTGLDALTPPTRCGIFAGERTCSKREAAAYGYGQGRDPVTVLGKLVSRIADPDR